MAGEMPSTEATAGTPSGIPTIPIPATSTGRLAGIRATTTSTSTANKMRADTYRIREMENKIKETKSFELAGKLIYQWVKQNEINPAQMNGLMVLAYKLHTY
jgi:hypothetical protein